MDGGFGMDACRCVALLRQRRRQSHRETRCMSGGDKLLVVCAGAVLETRLERIFSLESAAAKPERAGAVLQIAAPFSVGNSFCHHSLHSKKIPIRKRFPASGGVYRDAHDELAKIAPVKHADECLGRVLQTVYDVLAIANAAVGNAG